MIFYHVDRTFRLSPNSTVELSPYETETLYGSVFHNLSVHGNLYFRDCNLLCVEKDIEIALEYVRAVKYPHMPSRFQSLFASKSIDECTFWLKKFQIQNHYNLVEIESDRYTELDCSWFTPQKDTVPSLLTRCKAFSLGAMCDAADKYWSKEKTNTPIMEVLIPLPCKTRNVSTIKVNTF